MVETMASGEALFLIFTAFVVGYLTCSTIMLDDLQMKYDDLKEKYNELTKEKEYYKNTGNRYNYRDVA